MSFYELARPLVPGDDTTRPQAEIFDDVTAWEVCEAVAAHCLKDRVHCCAVGPASYAVDAEGNGFWYVTLIHQERLLPNGEEGDE